MVVVGRSERPEICGQKQRDRDSQVFFETGRRLGGKGLSHVR